MTRWTRVIPVVAIGMMLAACGVDPVGSGSEVAAPDGPRLNGGFGTGGNVTGGGGTTESGATTSSPASSADVAPTDTTTRLGGFGTGGN